MSLRRNVWFWTLMFWCAYGLHTLAADWTILIKPAIGGVVRLEMAREDSERPGTCSAALFNDLAGYAATMAHCLGANTLAITANGRHAETIQVNRLLDLAVIQFKVKHEHQLTLAKAAPLAGAEVALLGFAFGSKSLYAQFGHVALPLEDTGRLMLDVTVINGDSGGVAINAAGEVIGMTSGYRQNGGYITVMVPAETIADFIEPFLKKTAKP